MGLAVTGRARVCIAFLDLIAGADGITVGRTRGTSDISAVAAAVVATDGGAGGSPTCGDAADATGAPSAFCAR
ncbi:MAG: hypothetical protein M3O36_19190, partial [Myxococcota bacterium]|nr:hypothetical protein [Myxococcota bacterium]